MLRHANQFGDHYLHHFLYSINAVERYSIKKTSLHLHLDSGIILSSPVTVGTAGAQQPAPVCVWGGIQTQRAPVIGETKKEELARF